MYTNFGEISMQMTESIFDDSPLTLTKSLGKRQEVFLLNEGQLAIIRFVIFIR